MTPANQYRTIAPNTKPAKNNTSFIVVVPRRTARGAAAHLM